MVFSPFLYILDHYYFKSAVSPAATYIEKEFAENNTHSLCILYKLLKYILIRLPQKRTLMSLCSWILQE